MATTRSQSVRWVSPLRYPGGKGRMAGALAELFMAQFGLMDVEVWVEPFAGGAGAGLHLLDRDVVEEVWLSGANQQCNRNRILQLLGTVP